MFSIFTSIQYLIAVIVSDKFSNVFGQVCKAVLFCIIFYNI